MQMMSSVLSAVKQPLLVARLHSRSSRPLRCCAHGARVQVAVPTACNLGESPSWDGAAQKLLFVDINEKTIFIWDGSSTGRSPANFAI